MKKELKYDRQVTTFDYKNGFKVDIIDCKGEFEAWLYHKGSDVKAYITNVFKEPLAKTAFNENEKDLLVKYEVINKALFDRFYDLVIKILDNDSWIENYTKEYIEGNHVLKPGETTKNIIAEFFKK